MTSTTDAEDSNTNNNNNNKNKRSSDDEKEEIGTSRLNKFGKNNQQQHQHPVFERKTKVTGNDDFLKQIFS